MGEPAPSRIHGRAGEPAYAAFARLASKMGARSPLVFAKEWGLDHSDVRLGRAIGDVAAMAALSASELEASTFVVEADYVHLGRVRLDRAHWSEARPRVCPACVVSDIAWRRSWWDVTPLRRCHEHGDRLVREGQTSQRTSPDAPSTAGERYVLGRLGFAAGPSSQILDALPLSRAIDLLEIVGASLGGDRWALRDARRVDPVNLIGRGYTAFDGGVDTFVRHLDDLASTAAAGRDAVGPGEVYGRLVRWLASEDRDSVYEGVRDILRDHARRNLPIPTGTPVLGVPAGRQRSFTLAQVSRAAGVQPCFADRILRHLGHEASRRVAGLDMYAVEAATAAANFVRDTIWGADAAKRLGLSSYAWTSVVRRGIVKPAMDGRSSGTRDDRFWAGDVERLLRLADGAPALGKCPDGCRTLVAAARTAMSSTGEIVEALLDGRLRTLGLVRAHAGISGLTIRIADVANATRPDAPEDTVPWAEVVAELGRKSVADDLVAQGRLGRTTVPMGFRNRRRLVVRRADWTTFREDFVSVASVAAKTGTSAAAAARDLSHSGVEPAFVAGGRRFYERRSGERAVPRQGRRALST